MLCHCLPLWTEHWPCVFFSPKLFSSSLVWLIRGFKACLVRNVLLLRKSHNETWERAGSLVGACCEKPIPPAELFPTRSDRFLTCTDVQQAPWKSASAEPPSCKHPSQRAPEPFQMPFHSGGSWVHPQGWGSAGEVFLAISDCHISADFMALVLCRFLCIKQLFYEA